MLLADCTGPEGLRRRPRVLLLPAQPVQHADCGKDMQKNMRIVRRERVQRHCATLTDHR